MPNKSACLLSATALATALAATPGHAGTYTTLYQFTGGNDGAAPLAPVTYDEKGNLYGVTEEGANDCVASAYGSYGCGTVFKISASGQETTLVTFDGTNGANPSGRLTLVNHTLYGSARNGGPGAVREPFGDGVLFSVRADGTHFKFLHVFHGREGANPLGPLVTGPAGIFYGITEFGGPSDRRGYTYGVLFELMPDGTYLQLHDFTGGTDGGYPVSLTIDTAGTIYGSTNDPNGKYGNSVFRYVPSTAAFTTLHTFTRNEGLGPELGSIGPDGTLYGTTASGGLNNAYGSLFELIPAGDGTYGLNTLYRFRYSRGPGVYPFGGPVLTRSGALIGALNAGELYKYKFNHMTTLYTFATYSDLAPPTLDKNGTIYGAGGAGVTAPCTVEGYSDSLGCGFVYSFVDR
jgi:uncharacterized repeat protein (TIGR03803 family)